MMSLLGKNTCSSVLLLHCFDISIKISSVSNRLWLYALETKSSFRPELKFLLQQVLSAEACPHNKCQDNNYVDKSSS